MAARPTRSAPRARTWRADIPLADRQLAVMYLMLRLVALPGKGMAHALRIDHTIY
jgi:hypothetical protein